MCEEDYEVDENGKKIVHRLRLSVDDLMTNASEDKSKKKPGEKKRKRSPSPQPKLNKRKSGRSPAVFQKKGKNDDDDPDDLTKDLDDPIPEPNITEVKPSTSSSTSGPATPNTSKKDPESYPLKGAQLADLDEEMERGDDSQPGKISENSNTQDFKPNDDLEDNVTEQVSYFFLL